MRSGSITRRDAAILMATAAAGSAALAAETPELCSLTAIELVNLIRKKKASALEVMDAHLAHIERVNPKLNAIVTFLPEQARARARKADEAQAQGAQLGALHGLPTAHKDLVETAGVRTTFGSRIFKDHVPDHDALVVERVRDAGAISVGKTNTPEFGAGSQTFNEVFGATHNPYDLSKTCGGSSGGAAVALACRMLPIADGGDLGGSLRNPANFCNVVGFRPSPGRVPVWPATLTWSTMSVEGPIARTVSDAAFFLSALAGPDARSPISIDEAGAKFTRPLDRDFHGVRVAWWKDLGGLPVDARVREVVDRQRAMFESLGCVVEQAEPDLEGAGEIFKTLRYAMSHLASVAFPDRMKNRELVKDTILWETERGEKLTGSEVMLAELKRTELFHRMRHFLEQYEFFVLPVSQVPPFDVHHHYPTEIAGVKMETYIDWMKSCYYISLTASPAISVPAGFTPDGLPVGIQIVGRHRDDWGVLQMADAFEQARALGTAL